MADLYYIEEGYFTPEKGYYVYTADGAAAVDTSLSVSCDAELITTGVTVEANGSFNSEDTVSVDVSKIAGFIISLNVAFTQTATISHIHGSDLFAFSEAAIAAQVDRIRDNNIAATAVFDIATDVGRIQQSASDADAVFSAIVNGLRSRDFNSETQAAFSFSADTDKLVPGNASLNSEFTQTAVPGTIFEIDSTISSTATLDAAVGIVYELSSNITAESSVSIITSNIIVISIGEDATATLDIVAGILYDVQCELTSSVDISSDVNITADGVSSLQSQFTQVSNSQVIKDNELAGNLYSVSTLTATAQTNRDINTALFDNAILSAVIGVIKENQSSISSAFSQDTTANAIFDFISNVVSQSSIDAIINKTTDIDLFAFSNAAVVTNANIIKGYQSDLTSAVSVVADNIRVRYASAYTESIASELILVDKILPLGAIVSVVSTLSASLTVSYSARANTNVQAILQSQPIKQVSANIAISGAMQFTAGIRDLRLDEIEYRIPAEDWSYTIYAETRLLTINGETRQRRITQETALRTIAGETRLYTVD
jgi:hypothetical protein